MLKSAQSKKNGRLSVGDRTIHFYSHWRRLAALLLIAAALLSAAALVLRSFDDVKLLEEKGETSAGVSVGDLNSDGIPDIVLAKGRHWPLHERVLLNDGKGEFVASNLGNAPDRTYSAALADIDLDGDLDVVVSNDAPDRKIVYKNDGRAHFTEVGTFGDPAWTTRYVALADLDGDRYPDIVVANRGGDTAVPSFVCFNNKEGGFPRCNPLQTQSATSIAAADLDGDGASDLFVPHRDGGQSVVLWNDGKGAFSSSARVGPPDATGRIGVAGDLDGDGRPDLAFIDERKKAVFVISNRGRRSFGEAVQLPGPARVPYALALADLNRDRHLDVIVGWVEAPGSIYFSQRGRSLSAPVSWNDGKGVVYGLAFSDLNGDGWPDIVAARSDAPNAIWFSAPGKPQ